MKTLYAIKLDYVDQTLMELVGEIDAYGGVVLSVNLVGEKYFIEMAFRHMDELTEYLELYDVENVESLLKTVGVLTTSSSSWQV